MEKEICVRTLAIELIPTNSLRSHYFSDKRRYMALAVLSVSLFSAGEAFITFCYFLTKIIPLDEKSLINTNIDLFGILFLASYAVSALLSPLIYLKIGLKGIIQFGCNFNLMGVMLKLVYSILPSKYAGNRLDLKQAGYVIFGLSMGSLFSIPTLLSTTRFGFDDWKFSSLIPYTATSLGICLGFFDVFIIMGYKEYTPTINNYIIFQVFWELIINILMLIYSFTSISLEPNNPPSFSESERRKHNINKNCSSKIKEIITVMRKILCNLRSTGVLIISSLNHGSYIVVIIFIIGIIDNLSESAKIFQTYAGTLCIFLVLSIVLFSACIMIKNIKKFATKSMIFLILIFFIPLTEHSISKIYYQQTFENISTLSIFAIFLVFSPMSISFGCENLADLLYYIYFIMCRHTTY
ncbi:hypothetical protein MXB_5692 [Myxobolus squamalis]|nr:hypothetical protein MXB_5692 [Myxobolus squamalis]